MSDVTNTNSGNDAEAPQLRVADDALLERLRNRAEPADGDEPLVLRLLRFTGADLRGVNLSRAEITGSVFDSGDLSDARFVGARIEACSFVAAKLPRALFMNSKLSLVNFAHADLSGGDFRGASLEEVDVRDADLSKAIFDGYTVGTNFLDALMVQEMNVKNVDDLSPGDRVRLHNRGAHVHSGVRCPRCERFPTYFGALALEGDCPFCAGEGWLDDEEEDWAARFAIECPWCSGSGYVSYYMGGFPSRCLACEQAGSVGVWVIDRNRHEGELPYDFEEFKCEYDDLRRFTVAETDLSRLDFKHALIVATTFQDCSLAGTDFSGARFKDVDFQSCDLSEVNLTNVRMERVRFIDCVMARVTWTGGSTRSTSVARSDLTGAAISRQRLRKVVHEPLGDMAAGESGTSNPQD